MATIRLKEVTPDVAHSCVAAMVDYLNTGFNVVKVKRAGNLRAFGNCYWNVDFVVKRDGGQMVTGWLLSWFPDIYVTAVHHAVWQHPDGRLIDLTEAPVEDKLKNHTLFVVDPNIKISLDCVPCVDNKYFILMESSKLSEILDTYRLMQEKKRQYLNILWKSGYRCQVQVATAAGLNPPPILFSVEENLRSNKIRDEYIFILNVFGKLIHEFNLSHP